MTCAEWIARLATLQAAELKALIGSKSTSVQDGEHKLTQSEINLPALQGAIRVAQAHVNHCNGCARPMLIPTIPLDC